MSLLDASYEMGDSAFTSTHGVISTELGRHFILHIARAGVRPTQPHILLVIVDLFQWLNLQGREALKGYFGTVFSLSADKKKYRYAPHNDVSVNDGSHIRR